MERIGFGPRLGAAVIDVVILMIVLWVLAMLMGGSLMGAMMAGAAESEVGAAAAAGGAVVLLLLMALIPVLYFSLEIFMAATPGKMALSLRIRNDDGSEASMGTLTKRWLTKNIAGVFNLLAAVTSIGILSTVGGIAGLIIFIGCFFTLGASRQAFHDMFASTAVYKVG